MKKPIPKRKTLKQCIVDGDFADAMVVLDDKFIEDPDSSEAIFYFTSLMLQSEHPGPARVMAEYLTQKHPDKWQAWLNLGTALLDLDRDEDAKKAFKKVIELGGDEFKAEITLSTAATKLHQWDECVEWADKSIDRHVNIGAGCQAA